MEVILLEKINKLGDFGDTVTVASGYGRNYLLAKAKAIFANENNKKYFDKQKDILRANLLKRQENAQQTAVALKEVTLQIAARTVSSSGKLFGSVKEKDIVELLSTKHKIDLDKKVVSLPSGPVRNTGVYDVEVVLSDDIKIKISLTVISI